MGKLNLAILGAGKIAETMARTIQGLEDVNAYAVASRDLGKAKEFADKYGFEKAYGSYEEMLADPQIGLVYVATPHSHHYDHCKLCIEAAKPVLCEKAFTANAQQAEELMMLAKEKKVFITEAIWTRYMPFLNTIREVLDSGIIGRPCLLTGNLGYTLDNVPRMQDPALAGGSLLDLGVYAINFASMIFGDEVEKMTSVCTYTETGVDEQNSITLIFKDGRMAVLNSTMMGMSDRKGIIYGSKGFMVIENINNYESMKVFDSEYKEVASYQRPDQITGYEYEVIASKKALEEGKLACDEMPHEETIRVMKVMDTLRNEWGVRYPFE